MKKQEGIPPFFGLSEADFALQVKLDRVCNYRLWLIRHMAIRKTLSLFYYYSINNKREETFTPFHCFYFKDKNYERVEKG